MWASVLDSAKEAPDEGTFWAQEDRSWLWYNDRIETIGRTVAPLRHSHARRGPCRGEKARQEDGGFHYYGNYSVLFFGNDASRLQSIRRKDPVFILCNASMIRFLHR